MGRVERDPRASLTLGRREAHEDALVGVFGAVLVAAVESLRGSLADMDGTMVVDMDGAPQKSSLRASSQRL